MSSHRRHLRRAALTVTCCALAAPSLASAAEGGDTPADFGHPVALATMTTESPRSLAASTRVGDTPADFPRPVILGPLRGDTPMDFPGASRAPRFDAPHTISIVRPERTVVRDVDEALPIVVSSAALLLALCGLGLVLIRTGVLRRGLAERTH